MEMPARSLPTSVNTILRGAVVKGSVASILSTAFISALSLIETGHPASGTNATSHWIWKRKAFHQLRPKLRYTMNGYLIHHASSLWWAAFYEVWLQRAPGQHRLSKAAAIALLAVVVDYGLVPQRLTPGFEKHLSLASLVLIYAAFTLGLAIAPHTKSRTEKSASHHARLRIRQQRHSSSSIIRHH